MTVSDRTVIRANLGLLVVAVLFLMGLAYQTGQMSTKVDAMWSAYSSRLSNTVSHQPVRNP